MENIFPVSYHHKVQPRWFLENVPHQISENYGTKPLSIRRHPILGKFFTADIEVLIYA